MKVKNLEEFIDLDELAEEIYSVEESVEIAKEIIGKINSENENVNVNFYDDVWTLEDNIYLGHSIHIKFTHLQKLIKFGKYVNSSFINVDTIKCWTALLLNDNYPKSVQRKVYQLMIVLEETNFFDSEKLNYFLEFLRDYRPQKDRKYINDQEQKELNKNKGKGLKLVYSIINTTISFINYIDTDSTDLQVYQKELIKMREGLPGYKAITRILPKSRDVLKLNYCIEQYFKDDLRTLSRQYYAPILLWWKTTNIIPMRISEFCNIKRDATSCENGAYYITLPRKKQDYSKRGIQVIDTLEITKDIYDLVEEYKQFTNKYGESETLISWTAKNKLSIELFKGRKGGDGDRYAVQLNHKYFNSGNFSALLNNFYSNVVLGEFMISVERQVRPNDTRHFAFCSLMMQGISAVEIARLGGHSTLEAQYHYSNHTEYFIDVEVSKLIDGFKRENNQLRRTTLEGYELTMKDVEKKSYKFPPKNSVKLPLSIGYCTDSIQRCQSEECMLCDHWWIHPNEVGKYKPIIVEKIRERKQKIIEMGNFLKRLNESFTSAMVKENGIRNDELNKMDTESAAIREELIAIAKLEIIKGFDDFDE